MRNAVTTLIVTILTLTFIFGGYYLGNIKHDGHGSHCPFMLSDNAICTMEIREHIRTFSSIFMSNFFKTINIISLLILFFYIEKNKEDVDRSRYRIFIKTQNRLGVQRNLLVLLFSLGILNPKAP